MGDGRWARLTGRATAALCAAILLTSAALSYSAALTKSATVDEPNHIVSGWRAARSGDFRQDVANPPLWRMWAALASPATTLHLPRGGPLARDVVFAPDDEALWSTRTLYDTPGTDGGRFVNRGRLAMLLVAIAVGAALAALAFRLGGPVSALVATALFAFDPAVLAHASLIKSDLLLALAMLGLSGLAIRAGRRATLACAVGLGIMCALAVQAKFSGLLTGPMLAILLLLRALRPETWPALGRTATTRLTRLAAALGIGVVSATVVFTLTWACYGFRYRPARPTAANMDMPVAYARAARAETAADLGRRPTAADLAAHAPGRLVRFVLWSDDHRLLPQAFLAGLTLQYTATDVWPGYLNGQVYFDGRAVYFPLAVLYKTPLAELATLGLALIVGLPAIRRCGWPGVCIAVPAVIFGCSALVAHVNIGLRNLLPLYPDAALAAGAVAAHAYRRRPRLTLGLSSLLLTAQLISVATAWPDYLPYFNAAVGGPVEGLSHLADSNVDWGQDVPALAEWQRAHPGVPMYADLFLGVDPAFYGLQCDWLFTPDAAGRPRLNLPDRPAVLAVSATHLVGLYVDAEQRRFFAGLVHRPPREVLHGSIYLYDYRP